MTNTIRTLATTFALTLAMLVGSNALAAAPGHTGSDTVELDVRDESPRFDAAVTLEGQININTATAAELEQLPGIGPSIAGRIVSYREQHRFEQRNHIMRVKGVGPKTFEKIKDFLIVEGETTLRVVK
jgi:competence protein ComEA